VPPVITPAPVGQNPTTASNSANDSAGSSPNEESKPAKLKPAERADRHIAKARSGSDPAGTRVASAGNSGETTGRNERGTCGQ
jgi:hypothetical protein